MAEIVDDPKVPQTQVPEEVCGSFQEDTVVAEIVDDPKVPPNSCALGTVSLQFIPEGYCCGRNCC